MLKEPLKRWQMWAIAYVAVFVILVGYGNDNLWLTVIGLWAHAAVNYREGQNQAKGVYNK